MKIAKKFRWEMGHRLPGHKGLCRNVHGHSYRMVVEITGVPNNDGMIIDFYDLSGIIKPILDKYDHGFLCSESDKSMAEFLNLNDMKRIMVNYPSTVENICVDLSNQITAKLKDLKINNIHQLGIKVYETPNAFAEHSVEIQK